MNHPLLQNIATTNCEVPFPPKMTVKKFHHVGSIAFKYTIHNLKYLLK